MARERVLQGGIGRRWPGSRMVIAYSPYSLCVYSEGLGGVRMHARGREIVNGIPQFSRRFLCAGVDQSGDLSFREASYGPQAGSYRNADHSDNPKQRSLCSGGSKFILRHTEKGPSHSVWNPGRLCGEETSIS